VFRLELLVRCGSGWLAFGEAIGFPSRQTPQLDLGRVLTVANGRDPSRCPIQILQLSHGNRSGSWSTKPGEAGAASRDRDRVVDPDSF